jgi:hypothetical protein
MESIRNILIKRDGISPESVDELIREAQSAFDEYLAEGDQESAYEICQEFFGLEPDFVIEFF